MRNHKVVILTGAGISAESGLQTFRGNDGLWEGYRVEDVASPEGFARDPDMVLRFYNIRRVACHKAQPNAAHLALVELAKYYEVNIITQNIDDLHERAGSDNVLHLHGEILKSQSSFNPNLVYDIVGDELNIGDLCSLGSQLRPHVVWFGEAVPLMSLASKIVSEADIFVVIGTSLQVYPAANLLYDVKPDCEVYVIDPNASALRLHCRTHVINDKATIGVVELVNNLINRL